MDVLKPQLVEIGRCCYRMNTDFNTGQDMHYQDDYMQGKDNMVRDNIVNNKTRTDMCTLTLDLFSRQSRKRIG